MRFDLSDEEWTLLEPFMPKSREAQSELRRRNAILIAISPQTPRQNVFMLEQHGLHFPLLSDPGAEIAAHFGLEDHLDAWEAFYRSALSGRGERR